MAPLRRQVRQRFVCIECGVRVSGRLINGRVYAYDRAPDSDADPIPIVCMSCIDRRELVEPSGPILIGVECPSN